MALRSPPLLKERGYLKRALTWHKACPETVLVFHAEKNRWGANSYSFHLGIYLNALGEETTPPHFRCPVQIRLDRLVPNADELESASDFDDTSLKTEDRLSRLAKLVASHALPWLERYSSLPALSSLANLDYKTLLEEVVISRAGYDYLQHGRGNSK